MSDSGEKELERFMEDVNRRMDWMRMGVIICVVVANSALLYVIGYTLLSK